MNPKGISLTDVWNDIPPVRHSKYKNREANALSLKLLDRILDISTDDNYIILDPFGGSGTSYIAAELKNRRWIGIEKYTCQSIIDRFTKIDDDKKYLNEFRENLNTLFTKEAIKIRTKNKISNDKYNLK